MTILTLMNLKDVFCNKLLYNLENYFTIILLANIIHYFLFYICFAFTINIIYSTTNIDNIYHRNSVNEFSKGHATI